MLYLVSEHMSGATHAKTRLFVNMAPGYWRANRAPLPTELFFYGNSDFGTPAGSASQVTFVTPHFFLQKVIFGQYWALDF